MKPDNNEQQLLARYHDGQTTDAENQRVASLLADKPQCQQYLDELATLHQHLQNNFTQPRISHQLADRLCDIPRSAQQHVIARLAGGWAVAATILLLVSSLFLYQYQANTTIDPDSWQLDRMALGQSTTQYGIELTDNHKDLQLASLLIDTASESTR